MKIKSAQFSMCECGYPALDVPLGTEYELVTRIAGPWTWICGGCKREQKIMAVCVERPGTHNGWLPAQLFHWAATDKPLSIERFAGLNFVYDETTHPY